MKMEMDLNSIISIVSSVGFPIVCCIVMFKIYREDLRKMQESIDNNTMVIHELLQALKGVTKK
jgi:hypothetical protein